MILVVGLSSVWQRTLFYSDFQAGRVNRASQVLETASGKGVNVARVASTLGAKALVLTTAGGHRGSLFRAALRTSKLPAVVVPVTGETRLCQTLIASGCVTELVEEAAPLTHREVNAVLSAYTKALRKATLVILSGSVPGGCGDDFYARLARLAKSRGIPVLADTQKAQLVQAVREQPALVKINAAELAEATGMRSLAKGLRELARLGAGKIVISRGAETAVAFDGKTVWQVKPPRIKVINPIGSGDAMMAGIAVALVRGKTLPDALRLGIACGAANALTRTSGVIRPAEVKRLLQTRVRQ